MNQRSPMQPYLSNSLAIRQEIQRFESVHPSIYAIYDLIEAIPDPLIQQQIREHVVCIEDSFVNSQEWTLSRSVPDLKLGILGSVQSGKSALVHRYLTGSYMQEESPEGGRFKKEVMIDGQSYLLLIRDEGGSPEMQFTQWVDAVIFVFSLENELSFKTVYNHYAKMAHYRNPSEVPLILVGTQDAISENNPRMIDDPQARKLAAELRCSYYETCATYGLNVDRVFQDACQKIVLTRYPNTITSTPNIPPTPSLNHIQPSPYPGQPRPYDSHSMSSQSTSSSGTLITPANHTSQSYQPHQQQQQPHQQQQQPHQQQQQPPFVYKETPTKERELKPDKPEKKHKERSSNYPPGQPQTIPTHHYSYQDASEHSQQEFMKSSTYPVIVTPVMSRKNKRSSSVQKSNSFSGASDIRPVPSPTSTPIFSRKHRDRTYLTDNHLTLSEKKVASLNAKLSKDVPESTPSRSNLTPPVFTRVGRLRSSFILAVMEGDNIRLSYSREKSEDNLLTPSSTPTQSRKNRRRSNLFNAKKGEEEKQLQQQQLRVRSEELGSGRVIPIKQGYLYKKSHGLNKEWKKKYVTLLDDGRLTYHPSLHDYMDEIHGKEINLARTTVKIPGMRPRGSRTASSSSSANTTTTSTSTPAPSENSSLSGKSTKDKENVMLTAFDGIKEPRVPVHDENTVISNNPNIPNGDSPFERRAFNSANLKIETPNVKKRHRRAKSGGIKSVDSNQPDEAEDYEFMIVSLENKQWHFEAQNSEDRDEWVQMIEQQILFCLQGNESSKSKGSGLTSAAGVQTIRNVRGNNCCADCGAPNPDWASLNLGALVCIECSGIHRNLGTHLSRVRSLTLDEWLPDLVSVMTSIGNTIVNRVYEACTKGRPKPAATSARDEKERWIRAKYEQKDFLPPPPYVDIPFNQQLIDALVREDMRNIILLLGHCQASDINAPYSNDDGRTALHIAAALGNVVYVQLLLWYGADVKRVDHEGRNALWYARSSAVAECVELLINNGCPEHATMPRRRGSAAQPNTKNESFDKLPASVI